MKKKKYMVIARNKRIQESGITTGKGHRKFGEKSVMWVSDPAEAREIDTEFGMKGKREVAVTTDQQYEWSLNNEFGDGTKMNNIHNYTFQGVDMSGIRTTKDNGYVWVKVGESKQVHMKREEAIKQGLLPQKRERRRKGAEVKNGL